MRTYHHDAGLLAYAPPAVYLGVLASLALVLAAVLALLGHGLCAADVDALTMVGRKIGQAAAAMLCASFVAVIAAAAVHYWMPDHARIAAQVRRALCHPAYGNPLHLKDGELLPRVSCKQMEDGAFSLTIAAGAVSVDTIIQAAPDISTALNRRYERYAVVQTDADVAFNRVTFLLSDVLADKSLTFHSVAEMRPTAPTRLRVQDGTEIDLTTSGSMLVAGKTRSGKTTGIVALLLQALQCGPDKYGSQIVVIDPKQAELSRLDHVVTLDEGGEAKAILAAVRKFAASIVNRQQILNDLSEKAGDAQKWWDAGMHPSFLFLDEYVALRSLFPSKATKDDPDYCLATFDSLVKRIVTMGASAGSYMIISIAEASVQEGGLPAMLRSAMSTRILFRPTRAEGLLIWDRVKLDAMPDRVYGPGDAWFSSTDGEHDSVSYVHFPVMHFKVYAELGRLLAEYYAEAPEDAPPAAE